MYPKKVVISDNHTVNVRLTMLLRNHNIRTQTCPPAPRKSKRTILSHEDGVGGSYRYEIEEMYYNEETESLNQDNHNLMNEILKDFKTKVTSQNQLKQFLVKLADHL